jgi:hypothetical protein
LHPGKLLEKLRDRVVHRSQIGKRKLDRTATRRRLDEALLLLGRRFRALVKEGQGEVPGPLSELMEQVASLEAQLAEQDRELNALQDERPSSTT